MPSRLSSRNPLPNAAVDDTTEKSYRQLLAFLDLASGSTFAIARCNLPSLRQEILQRISLDAATEGVTVREVDISSNYSGDFVAAVKAGLDGHPASDRTAVMLTGIDGLIYQSASHGNLQGEGRTPFIARLNFDRERIARDLPFPIVFWLESESLTLLLKQAPDFTQWVSGHFHFGGPAAEAKALDQLLESYKSLPSQPVTETRKQLEEFSGLLQELNETQGHEDAVTLRKRLAVLNALSVRSYRLSDFHRAQKYWNETLEIARLLKDRNAESNALTNLGSTYAALGDPHRAIECCEQSLDIRRRVGDRRGEGKSLGSLGLAYAALGDHQRAIEIFQMQLVITHEIGDRPGEGAATGNLGNAYRQMGDLRRAIEYYEKQLMITREIRDRQGEGNALGSLGNATSILGETQRAIEYYEQALVIHREIGDRRGEAYSLGNLGNAYRHLGEFRRAIELHEKQLAITQEIGDRRAEGYALGNLGVAYADLREVRRAITFYEKALEITCQIGDRQSEGIDRWNMSLALDQLGHRAEAVAQADAALHILEQIEDPNAEKVRRQLAEWRKT